MPTPAEAATVVLAVLAIALVVALIVARRNGC